MTLAIHPEAAERVRELVANTMAKVSTQGKQPQVAAPAYQPEYYVAGRIAEKDVIGGIVRTQTDRFGNEVGRALGDDEGEVHLHGDAHETFARACDVIWKQKSVRHAISIQTVRNLVFDWVCNAHRGSTTKSVVEFVLGKCEELIDEWEVILPIAGLHVEAPFAIGRVGFKDLSKAECAQFRQASLSREGANLSVLERLHDKLERDYQGKATARVTLQAEREFAIEQAFGQSELALAALRLVSIGAFAPERPTIMDLVGREHVPSSAYLLIRSGAFVGPSKSVQFAPDMTPFIVDVDMIQTTLPAMIGHWSRALKSGTTTKFEEDAFRSMLLYSRATTYRNISEKLIHIFAALESLLLRDDREPITAAAADRLAFAVGHDGPSRMGVAKNMREAYSMRSKYVHHGAEPSADSSDLAILEQFLVNVSQFYINLSEPLRNHQDRVQYIDWLEARKYE